MSLIDYFAIHIVPRMYRGEGGGVSTAQRQRDRADR